MLWAADTAQKIGIVDIRDTVVWLVWALLISVPMWSALKWQAHRGSAFARGLYERSDSGLRALRIWVFHAPVVFTYMAAWTVTSVITQGTPEAVADVAARYNSTNIFSLSTEPLRVLFSSAFLVADYGVGFLFYVLVYFLIAARLEHRIGSVRFLFVAGVSHVVGSLLTVLVETWALDMGLAPNTLKFTQDVGVSFVMVGSLGAYLWLVGRRWRIPYFAAVLAGIGLPMLISHTIWDLGHFIAATLGTITGYVAQQFPMRDRIIWKDLVAGLPPRELPTFAMPYRDSPEIP